MNVLASLVAKQQRLGIGLYRNKYGLYSMYCLSQGSPKCATPWFSVLWHTHRCVQNVPVKPFNLFRQEILQDPRWQDPNLKRSSWTSQNLTRIGRCHLGSCEMSDPRRWQPTEEVSGVSQWLSLGTTDPWGLDFGEASLVWWGGPSKDPRWFPNPNVCPIKTERSLVLSSSPPARF